MKAFYSFSILFLFSVISTAQDGDGVVFEYPDYLCPGIENIVVNLDSNGRIDLAEFLRNAKKCLDQSDYDERDFIEGTIYQLCDDNEAPSCWENLKTAIAEAQASLLEYQQARILYPYGYQKVGELNEYEIEDANLVLQDGTSCICRDSFLASMLIYGNEAQHNRVMNRLKSLGPSCLRSMFDTLVNSDITAGWSPLQAFDIPESCLDQGDHPICRKLNDDAQIIRQRALSLVNAINTGSLDSSSLNSLSGGVSSDFISGLKNDLACSDYSIGEERQLRGPTPQLGAKYLVKRESENHYTASVAVRFTSFDSKITLPESGLISDYYDDILPSNLVYDHHIHTHYMQKVQECIKEANTKMLGPNGERLEIILKDANEVNSCEYQHSVIITTPPILYNASYTSYPSDIDNCATITHEILHVFGLPDEYDRKLNDKPIPYPIANSNEPSEDQILLYRYESVEDNRDNNYCGGHPPVQYNSIMANVFDRWNNVFEFGRDQSLLDPTHFNFILYGDSCTDKEDVQLYHQCYNAIEFTSDEIECSAIRSKRLECHGANVLGRTKQRELEILEHELSTDQESYRHKMNWSREKSSLPVIIEESIYDVDRQYLLKRLEAVRSWSNEDQSQK